MRPLLTAVLAATLALATPLAAASAEATITLEGPASAAPGARVPFRLTLQLSDFSCGHDRWVIVHLTAEGDAPGFALGADTLAFRVPEGSYISEPYVGTVESWASASGDGAATVTAELADDLDDCFTAGDLEPATASWSVTFGAGGATAPPPPANQTGSASPTNATNGSAATNGTYSGRTPTSGEPFGSGRVAPTDSGYIGDFRPEESQKATPGAGLVALLAGGAACASLIRRRR